MKRVDPRFASPARRSTLNAQMCFDLICRAGLALSLLVVSTGSGAAQAQDTVSMPGTTAQNGAAPPPLPQGNSGIAAQFPGDANIQTHPDVLFADGFETYSSPSQLTTRWDNYFQSANTRIATEPANVYAGGKALEFTLPQAIPEVSNAVVKAISPSQDTLFVRVYTKFELGYRVTTGSNHNGIEISAQYPGPGSPPDGSDFFLALLENSIYYNEADPGYTHVYIYHPEQRSQWGDNWYPDGKILPIDSIPGDFGPDFTPRSNFIPQTNRWYSYELMLKANTPGQRDGRVAYWIDGVLMADFQNVRLRDIASLRIDKISLSLHAQVGGSAGRPNKKWYDNVVVARAYIGPLSSGTVTDLRLNNAVAASGTLTATLGWTPPANAITTTLRCSSAPITDANWPNATLLSATLVGNASRYVATVPYTGGTAYFGLRTQVSSGAYSSLSNVVFWPSWTTHLPLVRK